MFAPQTYIQRRQALKQQIPSGLILMCGNDLSPINYPDNPYYFRQDSSFLYYFGLDTPSLVGLIDIDNDTKTIFGDDLTIDEIIWMGPQTKLSEKAKAVGVDNTCPRDKLAGQLQTALKSGRKIHFLPQYRAANILKLQSLIGYSVDEITNGASAELIAAVVNQRSVKSDEEIAQIESAIEICHRMQTAAMKAAQPGLYERQMVGLMEGIVLAAGSRPSFPTIFTVHGETLHNHHHGNIMNAGDIVINDSGAESALHYAGDITRTFPVNGTFTDRQKDIYSIVLDAQTAAMNSIMPGMPFVEVHIFACEMLATGLKDLGLMKGDVKDAVAAGAHALFFQCGLGHMLGLDVHDMEALGEDNVGYTDTIKRDPAFGIRSLRLGKALQPGYVITIEPGLYFIPQLIDLWKAEKRFERFINYPEVDRFRDFGGVRIEDDVVITASGARLLGPPIPRTIDEVHNACS